MSNFLWNVWLSFLDRTDFTVAGITGASVFYTRSAAAAYYTAGAIFCSLSVKVIKRLVKQPRPPPTARKLKKTYGMPSTHSAAISYLATYIVLASMFLPVHPSFPPSINIRLLAPVVALPWAVAVVMSRLWLGHHTVPQVLAGASYGVALASVWFSIWKNVLSPSETVRGFEKEVVKMVEHYLTMS
ncbi:hypothetical protein CPB83DRAFT_589943 [Crepidotus variabilis]|uniref:Phosphatidic acid phosphatase type 2/haloperoxidase domain-containing protein n=1 Tax=Crepidotus variabilis TaxID=179855 RepID=A0A9P6EQ03_9AGAR|nr:hypothetical protein CPB83DRAFT_589943 [Crepidotus variabilis]